MHGTGHPSPPPLPAYTSEQRVPGPDSFNPYAPPAAGTVLVHTAALAGRGQRLLAAILDALLYGIAFLPLLPIAIIHGEQAEPPPAFYLAMLFGGAVFLALFVYNLLLLQREGQTIAKRWLKLRIVRSDGQRADLGRIFALRMLMPGLIGAVPCIGSLFAIANALAIFGEQRRCIHDLFADTIVVDA